MPNSGRTNAPHATAMRAPRIAAMAGICRELEVTIRKGELVAT
jgi:hypothetical protein